MSVLSILAVLFIFWYFWVIFILAILAILLAILAIFSRFQLFQRHHGSSVDSTSFSEPPCLQDLGINATIEVHQGSHWDDSSGKEEKPVDVDRDVGGVLSQACHIVGMDYFRGVGNHDLKLKIAH